MEIHHDHEGPSETGEVPPTSSEGKDSSRSRNSPRRAVSEDFVRGMLERFLPRAFRKAVTEETIESYLSIATRHWGRAIATGRHAPAFATFSFRPASCIALIPKEWMTSTLPPAVYFLTQGPPDKTLVDLAQRGRLSATRPSKEDPSKTEYWVLRRKPRLLPAEHTDPMIQSFVRQWLDTDSWHHADPKFNFDETSIDIAKYETEAFFTEMLTRTFP